MPLHCGDNNRVLLPNCFDQIVRCNTTGSEPSKVTGLDVLEAVYAKAKVYQVDIATATCRGFNITVS